MKTGATSKMKATYTYDDDSNVLTEIVENVFAAKETSTYTYDRAQRLTSFNRQQGAGTPAMTTYRWDPAGNKVAEGASKTWTYDQRNRILTGPEGTYTWDPRGTLDKITAPSSSVTEYAYDGLGRQTQFMTASVTVDFTYDGLDRIATRTRGATTDAFAYSGGAMDPANVITGANATSYSRTPSGAPLAVTNTASSSTAFMGSNQHGDNRWNFNTSGTTTDSTVFDPFGSSLASTGSTGDNLGFQSDWTDPDSGNVWMGARWYSPASGTFQSRDRYSGELTTPVSLNRYTYGHSDPIGNYDPTGHAPCPAGLAGHVTGLDGNCYQEWAPGDPCGNGGFRGLDVNICIDGPYCFSLGQGFTNSGCVPCPAAAPSPLPSGTCVNLHELCVRQGYTGWAPETGECYKAPDLDWEYVCRAAGYVDWEPAQGCISASPPPPLDWDGICKLQGHTGFDPNTGCYDAPDLDWNGICRAQGFTGMDFATSTCYKAPDLDWNGICVAQRHDGFRDGQCYDNPPLKKISGGSFTDISFGKYPSPSQPLNKVGGGSGATTPPPGPGKVATMGPAKPDCFLGSNAYPPTGIQVAACYSGTGTSAPWPLLREIRLVAAVLEEVHARATSMQCSVFSIFSIASPEAGSVFVGTQSASAWVQRAFLKPSIHTTAAAASRASGWVTAGATAGDISCRLAGING
jgi:RHS repeat-associated protein